jgi:hypothetical protein
MASPAPGNRAGFLFARAPPPTLVLVLEADFQKRRSREQSSSNQHNNEQARWGMNAESPTMEEAALMQRDAAMMLLVAQSQGLIQQLALLANAEKAAVAGLVAVAQAVAIYAQSERPDAGIVAGFDNVIYSLAPAMARRIAAIRAAAPEPAHAAAEIAALNQSLRGLFAVLASAGNGPLVEPDEDPARMAGVLRSLLPRRPT